MGISNSRESTSTSTKPLEEDTSQEPSSWISNQEPWTPSELDHSVNSSDLITSSSDKPVPVTTGPRVITPKELNSSTPSSMSLERKPKVAIASKVSKSPTPSVVVPDPVWEPSSSPRSEKSTQIESWPLSPSCHPPRSLIPSLSHITPPSPSINSSRTPMRSCALITKLFTISASEPSSSPRRLTSKCLTSKTRTPLTSLSGSQTTSNPPSAISHQRDSRCLLPSSVTPLPSKRCSRELVSNSPPCLEERLSSIGTPVRVWTRWSSLKLNPT